MTTAADPMMTMKTHLSSIYAHTLGEAEKLIADVPCERCAEMPGAVGKHPAWVIGHLSLAAGMGADLLHGIDGFGEQGPPPWMQACMGEPTGERGAYPSKEELLTHLRTGHERFASALEQATAETWAAEMPNPDYRAFFPTIGDATFYLMAHHEGYHLGQLSQWRRAAGFGPVGG